ncbi:hypothetical protein BH10BAC2_BH10BAC2_36500 [soil metagenome]
MKTQTKLLAFLLLLASSCTKENINRPPSANTQSADGAFSPAATFTIGQSLNGGIIFYIDATLQHGLIAATSDQGTGISWNNGSNVTTNATGTVVGTGLSNTKKIRNTQGKTGTYAALLCLNYKTGVYKDWYLPSKDELNLLFQQRAVVGGFSGTNYWSSSEVSRGKAWDQEFGGGFQFKDTKSFTLNVRAISSF